MNKRTRARLGIADDGCTCPDLADVLHAALTGDEPAACALHSSSQPAAATDHSTMPLNSSPEAFARAAGIDAATSNVRTSPIDSPDPT